MTGIRVMCSGHPDYSHDPIRLTSIIDGDFTPTKRTWLDDYDSVRGRSWSVDCTRCKCSFRLLQSTVADLAEFIDGHPELLSGDTISATILSGVIRRLPKIRTS